MEIKAKTAEEAWKKMLKEVMKNGVEFTDRKGRICKEVLNIITCVETPESITKPIEILSSLKKWAYPSLEELKAFMLEKEDVPGYYYHYGARAFNYIDSLGNGLNQVDNYLIPLLKKEPTSKRGIIVFYNPEKDTLPLRKETPGMVMMNFNIRNKKLHVTSVIRSNDLFFGWPGNIVQTYFLADYVSKELNVPVGTLNTTSISAHIFEDQFEDINRIIGEN